MKVCLFFLILSLSSACSKTNTPVRFSSENQSKIDNGLPENNVLIAKEPISERIYTILELYIERKVEKDYVLNWLFLDAGEYREKLYLVKSEIKSKMPLSPQDTDRLLALEYALNDSIRLFNDRNVLYRSRAIVGAAYESYRGTARKITSTASQIEREGVPPQAIANNPNGYLGSFARYGFKIEEVSLFDLD